MIAEPLLGGKPEIARRSAGGDDERAGGHTGPVGQDQRLISSVGELKLLHRLEFELRAETLGLTLHRHHQIESGDPIRKSGEILDFGRLGQQSARHRTAVDQRTKPGAGGVNGRGTSGRSVADDDQFTFLHHKPSGFC